MPDFAVASFSVVPSFTVRSFARLKVFGVGTVGPPLETGDSEVAVANFAGGERNDEAKPTGAWGGSVRVCPEPALCEIASGDEEIASS